MFKPANLRLLVGVQVREENRLGIPPLTSVEVHRLERFAYEAAIPHDHRFYCKNAKCGLMFDVNLPAIADGASPRAVCPHCDTASCTRCGITWHGALTCSEVEAMGGVKVYQLQDAFINATSKPCPNCGHRITHYHGRACRPRTRNDF